MRHRLRQAVKGGNALICLRLRFLGHAQLVHEIPAIRPELAAQDVLVEEIRGLGTFDRQVDMLKRSFLGRLVRRFEGTQPLHGIDFFLDILCKLLVRLCVDDA